MTNTHYERLLDAAADSVRAALRELMEETDTDRVMIDEDLLRDISATHLNFFLIMN